MKISCYIIFIFSLCFSADLYPQQQKYVVKRASFSSGINDEFSPVFYNRGIVFCSNMRDNSPIGYRNDGERLFNIVYVESRDKTKWKTPVLFSGDLTSVFNDGPATFNQAGTVIYFSRNNSTGKGLRNIIDTSNKLGIYRAEFKNGEWSDAEPLSFINPGYSFSTPSLSPDGRRIFFSSDMPGGYGGSDLYYCDSINSGWDKPVNLGPVINTSKNESFPFSAGFGMLFFASDGHPGFGGKDIFYTREINCKWIDPVHLDSGINSPADDFGLVTDTTLQNGYFSTDRLKTDDIFAFASAPVEFAECDTILKNRYCFTFYDERHQLIDTIPAEYIWDFGDGLTGNGPEVYHCFPGQGIYSVRLTILDELTGDTIAARVSYDVEINDIEQPVIISPDVGTAGKLITFEGSVSSLYDVSITDYFWNYGEGFNPGGPETERVFRRKGEYDIKMGVTGINKKDGSLYKKCVKKKIIITSGD